MSARRLAPLALLVIITVAACSSGATSPTLPGEPWDIFTPQDGEALAVVGLAHDDMLDVRSGPGSNFDSVATIAPTATEVLGTGAGRLLDGGSLWWQVEAFGTTGWVNSRFVSRTALAIDLTQQVFDTGAIFNAPGMEGLGLLVAEAVATVDPPSDIVMSVAPSGNFDKVIYDVIGLGDDSLRGYRLLIHGGVSGLGNRLESVEATPLCARGVSPDGQCV